MLLLQARFGYTSARLGLFSGVIGLCFVFGLLFVVRRMLRVWRVVDIAKTGLLVAGVGCGPVRAVPARAGAVGARDGRRLLRHGCVHDDDTAFSDAVSEDRQGWALGVAGR